MFVLRDRHPRIEKNIYKPIVVKVLITEEKIPNEKSKRRNEMIDLAYIVQYSHTCFYVFELNLNIISIYVFI